MGVRSPRTATCAEAGVGAGMAVVAEHSFEQIKARSALMEAIFSSAYFWQMATDAAGVIQIFNVGAEAMLGYDAVDVVDRITPADISDPEELIKRAAELSAELDTPIAPGFEALVFKAKRGIEDSYELTYVRKDGSRFPAVVSVTALRDAKDDIIGYLLIGTDNTAGKARSALSDAIFSSAYFSQMATDERGVIQIFNVGAERMLGDDAVDVVDRITPADISDPGELIKRAAELSAELDTPIAPGFEALVFKAKRGIEDIYELTYVRKDGSRFPAVVSVTALRDAQDDIIGYLLIGTDNTARKEVEAAQALLDQQLRDQQFYTRSLIESNVDALMTTDPQGTITDVNQEMMTLTGCTRAELIGAPFRDFFTDPARADAGIARVLAEHKVTDYELTVRAREGQETYVSYNASTIHDRDGNLQGVFAAARDVTEQRQAAQYSRSLLEAALDPLVTISAAGTITDVNEATVKVTGVPRPELIGTSFSDYFTDPDKANEGYQLVFDQGSVIDYPLTLRHRDGALTDVLYNASVYRDAADNVLGVFAAARDVTDRRRIERTLQEKNVELEHASRMKSEFLATMSHELRTPLNSVIGFSEALKDGLVGELTDSQKEYIGDIFTSGQHLLSLINDILDLSKVEAGMMNLEIEAVDVNKLLSNALSIVREKAAERRISLDLELDNNLGVTQLDMRKTKQIVYNLLSNAVKFSSRGGLVSLRARYVPRSSVGTLDGAWPVRRFALADNEFLEFLEIRVTDGGIGISEENMAKLFQAFTQIDSSLARRFEGTGLGLAMVKQMTELLGGTVAVASEEGEGACFAAWVPLRRSAKPASTERRELWGESATAVEECDRVALVVDDDDEAAVLVRIIDRK